MHRANFVQKIASNAGSASERLNGSSSCLEGYFACHAFAAARMDDPSIGRRPIISHSAAKANLPATPSQPPGWTIRPSAEGQSLAIPRRRLICLPRLRRGNNLFRMLLVLRPQENFPDHPLFIDEETRPVQPHIPPPIKLLFPPDPILVDDPVFRIRDKREGE